MSLKTIICLVLVLLRSRTKSSPQLKSFTFEEVIPLDPEFFPDEIPIEWVSDSEYVYNDGSLWKVDIKRKTRNLVLDGTEMSKLYEYTISSFSKDMKYLLLSANEQTDPASNNRFSSADYWILNIESKSMIKVGRKPLNLVVWGPGLSLAYVKENNVYYVRNIETDQAVLITGNGKPGEISYGITDWLFVADKWQGLEAMWFSPDGGYLAVASFNETAVDTASRSYYGQPIDMKNQYPKLVQVKYSKAGCKNPVVRLQVFRLDNLKKKPSNVPAPIEIVGSDHYLGRVDWASERNLIVLWMNRRQNVSVLVNCDMELDRCGIVKKNSELNGWIDVREAFFDTVGSKMFEVQFFDDGDQRLPHVGRFDFLSLTTDDLSPGHAIVTKILGWNQDTNTVYYVVSPHNRPWMRQMWATSAGMMHCVSCGVPTCHHVSASFSPSATYAIVTCSSSFSPPKIFFYSTLKNTFTLFMDNSRISDKLKQYKWPKILFNVISEGEKPLCHVKLLLPPDMKSGLKYPMIVKVSDDPGSTAVQDNFKLDFYEKYLTTNKSYIVASIDVRGSGVMGVEALHAINNALGTVEVTDTLAAIRSLISVYPFIDPERIGVWGWRYGGFLSSMMLIQDDLNTLSCAAAVAPITSWLYANSMYAECYMDTPQANPEGYARSDVIRHAEKLRGRQFLLVHGTDDDFVHYQNSMMLAKVLQLNNIAFQQMSYVDEGHNLYGVVEHFYHTLDHFWTKCFENCL